MSRGKTSRGADRRCTVVARGQSPLAPTGDAALPRRFRRRRDQSQRVRRTVRSSVSSVSVWCRCRRRWYIIIILLISRFRYHSRGRDWSVISRFVFYYSFLKTKVEEFNFVQRMANFHRSLPPHHLVIAAEKCHSFRGEDWLTVDPAQTYTLYSVCIYIDYNIASHWRVRSYNWKPR